MNADVKTGREVLEIRWADCGGKVLAKTNLQCAWNLPIQRMAEKL